MPLCKRPKICKAFTLLELILVSVISMLILAQLGSVFYYSSKAYSKASRSNRSSMVRRDVKQIFSGDVSRLHPSNDPVRPVILTLVDKVAAAKGFSAVRFICNADLISGSSASMVDYFVYSDGDNELLVRRSETLDYLPASGFAAATSGGNARYEILADNVEAFKLRFVDDKGNSFEDWPQEFAPKIPVGIELEFSRIDGAGKNYHFKDVFTPLISGGSK